jgi:hypothetical protein
MNSFFWGGLSGVISLGVTYTNDTPRAVWAQMAKLSTAERYRELYRGFPSYAGINFVYFGMLFGVYEYLSHKVPKPENAEKNSLVSKFGAAYVAEKSGSILVDPFFRYLAYNRHQSNLPKFQDWATKVFMESGIRGFYQSAFIFRPRAIMFAFVLFSELYWYFFREK